MQNKLKFSQSINDLINNSGCRKSNLWLVSTENKNYNFKNLNITNLYKRSPQYNNDFLYPNNNKIYEKEPC